MKKSSVLLGASLLAAGALFVYFGFHHIFILEKPTAAAGISSAMPKGKALASRVDEQGGVSVEVRPLKIEPDAPWQFEVIINAHSGDLDADLTKQAALYDEESHFYKPLSWTGSPPGGHHREGTLTFAPLEIRPKFLELKIKNIGEIPVRTFSWDLK